MVLVVFLEILEILVFIQILSIISIMALVFDKKLSIGHFSVFVMILDNVIGMFNIFNLGNIWNHLVQNPAFFDLLTTDLTGPKIEGFQEMLPLLTQF